MDTFITAVDNAIATTENLKPITEITIPRGTDLFVASPGYVVTNPKSDDVVFVNDEDMARFETVLKNTPMFISKFSTTKDITAHPVKHDTKKVTISSLDLLHVGFEEYYFFLPDEYEYGF